MNVHDLCTIKTYKLINSFDFVVQKIVTTIKKSNGSTPLDFEKNPLNATITITGKGLNKSNELDGNQYRLVYIYCS